MLALASTGLLLCLAPSARAGKWAQVSCSLGGKVQGTEGWSEAWRGEPSPSASWSNTCAKPGGSLTAVDVSNGHTQGAGTGAKWVYTAPAGSLITGGLVTYSLRAPRGIASILTEPSAGWSGEVEGALCLYPYCGDQVKAGTGQISTEHSGGSELRAEAICVGLSEGTCPTTGGVNAEVSVSSAEVVLANNAVPTASGFAGTLFQNPAPSNATFTFTAHDLDGPGVYNVTVAIDGEKLYSDMPQNNGGKCTPVWIPPEGYRVFQSPQPCPQSVPVSIEVPQGRIPPGEHQLTVEVEDAAGNKALAYNDPVTLSGSPASISVSPDPITSLAPDRGPCNGSPCEQEAELATMGMQAQTFTRAWTGSAVTLSGRLTDPTGTPIVGAQVQLSQQVVFSATPPNRVASTTTNANGQWSLRVQKGPSRWLQVSYYSHLLDSVPAAILLFHENVWAPVSMHAPRDAWLGHAVVFSGRLEGGYVPSGGESIQMEIFYGRRWRTIEVLPTTSGGQWTYKYTFTLGAGASYRFRAVTVPNGAYPFSSAHSKPVRITVRR